MAKKVESINDIAVPFVINFLILLAWNHYYFSTQIQLGKIFENLKDIIIVVGTFIWGIILPAWIGSILDLL